MDAKTIFLIKPFTITVFFLQQNNPEPQPGRWKSPGGTTQIWSKFPTQHLQWLFFLQWAYSIKRAYLDMINFFKCFVFFANQQIKLLEFPLLFCCCCCCCCCVSDPPGGVLSIDTTSHLTDGQTNLYFNCPLCDPQTNVTPGLEKSNNPTYRWGLPSCDNNRSTGNCFNTRDTGQASLKEFINYNPFLNRFKIVETLMNMNLFIRQQKISSQLLFSLKIGSQINKWFTFLNPFFMVLSNGPFLRGVKWWCSIGS